MKIFLSSLVFLFFVSLVLFLYRNRWKSLENLLRLLAVIIVLLAFLSIRPAFSFRQQRQSELIILVDDSQSMETDLKMSQVDQVLSKIGSLADRAFTFSEDLRPLEKGKKVIPSGKWTNISQAIEKAGVYDPGGLVIISDGNHNFGADPSQITRLEKFPVYTIGVGRELKKDVEVVSVDAPTYVFYGEKIKARVRLKYSGYKGKEVRVSLKSSTGSVVSVRPTILDGSASNDLDFEFVPGPLGRNRYEIEIESLPDDDNASNNRYDFYITVLKEKSNLLYYTSNLSENVGFFQSVLKDAKSLNPVYVAEVAQGIWYEIKGDNIRKVTFPRIEEFEVVIFDDVDFAEIRDRLRLEEFLAQGGGVLVLAGEKTRSWGQFLETVISFRLNERITRGVIDFRVASQFSVLEPDQELPPFAAANAGYFSGKDGVVVAETEDRFCLIGYSTRQKGKLFLVLGYPIWQWGFRMVGLDQGHFVPQLMADIVRFLSPLAVRSRIDLKTRKEVFNLNEAVEFTGQTFDENLVQKGGYEVLVRIGSDTITMVETEPGHLIGEYIPTRAGEFKALAYSNMDGSQQLSNEIAFRVKEISVEAANTALNQGLLSALAQESGGRYLNADSLADFKPDLRSVEKVSRIAIDFSQPLFLVFFCLLLVGEWILRKRRGYI